MTGNIDDNTIARINGLEEYSLSLLRYTCAVTRAGRYMVFAL